MQICCHIECKLNIFHFYIMGIKISFSSKKIINKKDNSLIDMGCYACQAKIVICLKIFTSFLG